MGRPTGKSLNPVAFVDLHEKLFPPLTRAEIAEAAGISPGALSDLMTAKSFASDKVAHELARVLNCKRETLFPEYVQFGPRPRTPRRASNRKAAA